MGGAIVATFLRRSSLADAADAVVLDSPVLDWVGAMRRALRSRRLPPGAPAVVTHSVRAALRLHGGLRAGDLVQRSLPERLATPVLLVHGAADDLVPVTTSDALAAARPDLVTYLRVRGAGHVERWNHHPARHDSAVAAWATTRLAGVRNLRHHGRRTTSA
jgi:fermentation-respiration switch protein FrsA (DUF1100 family)